MYGADKIRVGDAALVLAPDGIDGRARKVTLLNIDKTKKRNYVVANIDIVRALSAEFPRARIECVGENDTCVFAAPEKPNPRGAWQAAKAAMITLMLFAGAATAIMAFESDSQMPKIFEGLTRSLLGEGVSPAVAEIPYAIGLAAGILIFFNHVFGKKITEDPTPIQVEMTAYETGVADMIIDSASAGRIARESGSAK